MSEFLSGRRSDVSSLTQRVRLGDDAAVAEAVELIPRLDPGPETVALLTALPHTADRYALSVLLTAWDRQLSWTQAQLYGAAQPFACSDSPERGNLETVRHALGLSAPGAKNIVAVARRLFTLFASTLGLLQGGQISRGHVWGLIETTADLDDDEAGQIEDLVLTDAPGQTIAEFRRALDRARLTVCPEAARDRHDRKVGGRDVSRWTDRDGIGRLHANLPPEDIAAAWEALCRRADEIAQPDDPRARPARLADALVEAITGVPAANDPRRRPDTPATPDEDWLDQSAPAADGSIPAAEDAVTAAPVEQAQRIAPEPPAAPDQPSIADQPTAVAAPVLDGGSCGDEVEIHIVVLASRMHWRPEPVTAEPTEEPGAQPPVDGGAVVLQFANRATRRAGSRPAGTRRGRPLNSTIWAVIGLDSLLGRADVPGEIHTFGAVPAAVVRRMAQGRVILRRLVIDDGGQLIDAELTISLPAGTSFDTGLEEQLVTAPYRDHPLDYGATVYRLPADLDRHVVLRDRTCTIPGCGQPALHCDGEHALPWPRGSTSEANCGAMCRWHHRLKTHSGWTVTRLPDGSALWTSPEGLTRRRPPFDYTRYIS